MFNGFNSRQVHQLIVDNKMILKYLIAMNIEKLIEEKKAEIEAYKVILAKPAARGRWYDSGVRHLEELERQLKELENG